MRISCHIHIIRNVFFQTIRLDAYSVVKRNRNARCIIMTDKGGRSQPLADANDSIVIR